MLMPKTRKMATGGERGKDTECHSQGQKGECGGLPWEKNREEQSGARQLGVGCGETGRPMAFKSHGTIKGVWDARRTRKWS